MTITKASNEGLVKEIQDLFKPGDENPKPPKPPQAYLPLESDEAPESHERERPDGLPPEVPSDQLGEEPYLNAEIDLQHRDGWDIDLPGEAGPAASSQSNFPGRFPVFETWAFYAPFHFYRKRWGIYVLTSGILKVAAQILGKVRVTPAERWIFGFSYNALLLHELFHHRTELAISRMEAVSRKNMYAPFFWNPYAAAVEEAAANAYLLQRFDVRYSDRAKGTMPTCLAAHPPCSLTFSQLTQRLKGLMDGQPGPYRQYKRFYRQGSKAGDLLIDYGLAGIGHPPVSSIVPSDIWFGEAHEQTACAPVYLIDDTPSVPLMWGKAFPKFDGLQVVVHTRDHKPPHIHALELNDGMERRFKWPGLDPLKDDEDLLRPRKKDVEEYVKMYRREIDRKVQSVPWK